LGSGIKKSLNLSRNLIRVLVWLHSIMNRGHRRIGLLLLYLLLPTSPNRMSLPCCFDLADIRYAVFPERLEVMSQSNLMKVVGRINGDLVTIEGRLRDSGWALIMPEAPGEGTASPPPASPLASMMRWVTGELNLLCPGQS
jgi:hypothetical protein